MLAGQTKTEKNTRNIFDIVYTVYDIKNRQKIKEPM